LLQLTSLPGGGRTYSGVWYRSRRRLYNGATEHAERVLTPSVSVMSYVFLFYPHAFQCTLSQHVSMAPPSSTLWHPPPGFPRGPGPQGTGWWRRSTSGPCRRRRGATHRRTSNGPSPPRPTLREGGGVWGGGVRRSDHDALPGRIGDGMRLKAAFFLAT